VHPDVFAEMWFGPGGEFDMNDDAARIEALLAERRRQGQGGSRQEQDEDDDDNEDLDNGAAREARG
jgi:hypothetical protein